MFPVCYTLFIYLFIYLFPPCGTAAQPGPWPPHSWGF